MSSRTGVRLLWASTFFRTQRFGFTVTSWNSYSIVGRSSQGVIACTGRKCEDGQGWVLAALRREAGAVGHVKPQCVPALIVRVEH